MITHHNFDLNSKTCFKTIKYENYSEQWHKDATTGDTIILHCWDVSDGDDCISREFEVVEVIPNGGLVGKLKRLLAMDHMDLLKLPLKHY